MSNPRATTNPILPSMRNTTVFLTTLALAMPAPLMAQSAAPFDFSIKNIMRGPELYGTAPANVRWSADSRWIYFSWIEPGSSWNAPPSEYRVRAVAGAKPEKLTPAQVDSAAPYTTDAIASSDGKLGAEDVGGDIYLIDLSLIHISEPTRQAEISYAVFCLK